MPKRGEVLINTQDIIGKRLGKLKVKEYVGNYVDYTAGGERLRHLYLVHCDCGAVKCVQKGSLVSEIVHSCGCGRRTKYGH